MAASLLHAVELDELACADVDGYAATVAGLAADPSRRAQLRTHLLAQRTASPLFDGARQAREIEHLYRRMWDRGVRGLAPDHLAAEAAPFLETP